MMPAERRKYNQATVWNAERIIRQARPSHLLRSRRIRSRGYGFFREPSRILPAGCNGWLVGLDWRCRTLRCERALSLDRKVHRQELRNECGRGDIGTTLV